MIMEFIEWPKFMPQFYTAPNANLRFKNEYNYDIGHWPLQILFPLRTREKLSIFMYRNSRYIIEYGISRKPIPYGL